MFKRMLLCTGTLLLGCSLIWALLLGLHPPKPIAASPAFMPSNAPSGHPRTLPLRQTSSCIEITTDLTSTTTWNAPCYRILTNTVTIPPSATLTIFPAINGTRIEFDEGAEFHVRGSLFALGSPSQPITFTSMHTDTALPCDWGGIVIENDGRSDLIQHAVVEYACAGILINDQDGLQILSSTFRFNGDNGTPDDGAIVGTTDDNTRIVGNQIYSCTNGISLKKSFGNEISYNQITDLSHHGIAFIREGAPGGNDNLIAHNRVSHCDGHGLWVDQGNDNVLLDNEIFNCRDNSVYLEDGDGNQILSNTLYANGNSAVLLSDQTGANVQYNYVYTNGSGNQAGLYISGTNSLIRHVTDNVFYNEDAPAVVFAAGTATWPGALFQDNALCSRNGYEFINDGYSVDAPHNWWSSNLLPGDSISGSVTFTPWITLAVKGDAAGVIDVTLRDLDGHTVPPPSTRQTTPPAPDPRTIHLSSNWGTLEQAVVHLDASGFASTHLVAGNDPAPEALLITATDFCGYAVTGTLAMPNLAITKTSMVTQVPVGQPFAYEIAYANTGNASATQITLTDSLPNGMRWLSDTAPVPWTRVATTPGVVWSRPALAAGEQGQFSLTVVVETDAGCAGPLVNTANITGTTLETRLDDNEDSAAPVDILYSDVAIAKSVAVTEVFAGQNVSFTIGYANVGGATAEDVTITDELPPGSSYVSDTSGLPRTGDGAGPITWTLAALPAHSSWMSFTLVLRVAPTVAASTWLTNSASIGTSSEECARLANNRAEASVVASGGVDLGVLKNDQVGPPPILPRGADRKPAALEQHPAVVAGVTAYREYVYEGDVVTYTIVAYNNGPYPANNVIVSETLPLHSDYMGYGWTHIGGRSYITQAGTLLPEHFVQYEFVVRIHDPITESVPAVYNRVCVAGDEADSDPLNNCWDEDTPVRVRSLRIAKSAPRCIAPGDAFDYSTFYTNTNLSQAFTHVLVTDTLPASVSYRGTGAWQCNGQDCHYSIPTIPTATYNHTGPTLPVRLDASYAGAFITNVIRIQRGNTFTLVTPLDTGPDLVVVKNDNVGPLPLQAQATWNEISRALHRAPQRAQTLDQPLFVRPGERITYTILYLNSGVGLAHNVVITERLPEHTRYVGDLWSYAGNGLYTYEVGDLPAHMGGELVFTVEVFDTLACGVDRILNLVTIAGDEEECDNANNSSNDDTPVETGTRLYVANRDSDTLDVFRTTDFAHVDSIAAGPQPFGMASQDNLLYVVNSGSPGSVSIINLDSGQISATAQTGNGSLMAAEANGYVYVTNHSCCGDGISIVSSSGQNAGSANPTGSGIADWSYFGITYDSLRDRLYTTKRYMGGEGIWTLSPYPNAVLNWVVNTQPGSNNLSLPYATVYAPQTDHLYVTFPHLNQVRIYDPETFALLGSYGTQAQALSATNPGSTDGGKGMDDLEACVYNANFAAGSVTVIAEGPCISQEYLTAPVIAPPFGGTGNLPPQGTIILPGRGIYLPLIGRNAMPSSESPPPNVSHIALSGRPKGVVAGQGCVYVALPEQNQVAVIDARSQTVIHEISTYGDYPVMGLLSDWGETSP